MNIKEVKIDNGVYYFKLEKLLKENNVSINKLMRATETDFKVIKRLINGDLVKIDIFVLARLCNYFNCKIEDIIEFRSFKNM